MIFPIIVEFAQSNELQIVLATHQNHYPDVTFIHKSTDDKIALDLKSTYRLTNDTVNGMTLGAFTGYFRKRDSCKNISFPYSDYSKHFILGIIYSRADLFNSIAAVEGLGIAVGAKSRKAIATFVSQQSDDAFCKLVAVLGLHEDPDRQTEIRAAIENCLIDEKKRYALDDLASIMSVVKDFDFFVQEKWRLAIDRPGSGNTKNIGSSTSLSELKNGTALFTRHKKGEEMFNDYWQFYLTKGMAKEIDSTQPYTDVNSYLDYKRRVVSS